MGTTHSTAKWIPCHEIEGVEIRGVCMLVYLGQQCFPDPTHEPRHGSLCCIGSVSRHTVHYEETVGVNSSSQPMEEVAHCCNESEVLADLKDDIKSDPTKFMRKLAKDKSVSRETLRTVVVLLLAARLGTRTQGQDGPRVVQV